MTEPYARPDVRRFLDYLSTVSAPRHYEVTPEEARDMGRKSRDLIDAPVGEIAVNEPLTASGPGGDIPLRLFDARHEREAGPALIFLHGGGFVLGGIHSHEPFCAEIARQLDLPVIAVDYRLAPEHPWPAAVEDAIAAARWIADNPGLPGRQVKGLVLAGDSAGGNLAIVTSLALRDEPAVLPVLAQWLIYPAADPAKRHPSFRDFGEGYFLTKEGMRWFDDCYKPDPKDWRYSPLLKSQMGMPPTLVLTAGLDPIRDQGRAYAAACVEAGVPTIFREAAGNIHGFINLRKVIPSSKEDIGGCTNLLKTMIREAQGQ